MEPLRLEILETWPKEKATANYKMKIRCPGCGDVYFIMCTREVVAKRVDGCRACAVKRRRERLAGQ